ncbi:MAG: rhodanese-related sulfurtransferase [Dehalococcoidia bacterium]
MNSKSIKFAALYKFFNLDKLNLRRDKILQYCNENKILGTILLAKEGINGTIAGKKSDVDKTIVFLEKILETDSLEVKYSFSSSVGFYRMKVKIKNEIVTMGEKQISPSKITGTYVEAEEWNNFISQKDVLLIDARNIYETSIGKFKNSVDPLTSSFRDFPEWVDKNLKKIKDSPKIAMYCTGGIRCEKASSYLLDLGISDVYQLKGGILKYLESVSKKESMWDGECFVFDQRVSIKHGLAAGNYTQCYACKNPISYEDTKSQYYKKGVSCHICHDKKNIFDKARYEERQNQIEINSSRGKNHIGRNTESYEKTIRLKRKHLKKT